MEEVAKKGIMEILFITILRLAIIVKIAMSVLFPLSESIEKLIFKAIALLSSISIIVHPCDHISLALTYLTPVVLTLMLPAKIATRQNFLLGAIIPKVARIAIAPYEILDDQLFYFGMLMAMYAFVFVYLPWMDKFVYQALKGQALERERVFAS